MHCRSNGAVPINSFALVAYTPDPLGSFLDRLREELVPECRIQSHVTVLPPRPLHATPDAAWEQLQAQLIEVPAFEVSLGEVDVFPITSVIYLSVESGRYRLEALHAALNTGYLAFDEPYPYHPHVTLAQNFDSTQVKDIVEVARRRWAEYKQERAFLVERLTFVQNTQKNQWVDLAECQLLAGTPILR